MENFVYIIYSERLDIYYKGYSLNPKNRLIQHNNNESRYTCEKGPWVLVFLQQFESKKLALIREKSIKKYSKIQLTNLINSCLNQLPQK